MVPVIEGLASRVSVPISVDTYRATTAEPALDAVITGESPFDALPDVMPRLSRTPGDEICHRVRY